jgi:hypothetical protein
VPAGIHGRGTAEALLWCYGPEIRQGRAAGCRVLLATGVAGIAPGGQERRVFQHHDGFPAGAGVMVMDFDPVSLDIAFQWACWPGGAAPLGRWRVLGAASSLLCRLCSAVSATPATAQPAGTRRAVAPPSADHRLDRPPSISAAQIGSILARYDSPARGQGRCCTIWAGTRALIRSMRSPSL